MRYVAFLRGVSPVNAKMPEVKRCFESAGFTDVRTLLSSGNVAFSARAARPATLKRRAEEAMQAGLGRAFAATIRASDALAALLARDPFDEFGLGARAKRVISFLPKPFTGNIVLPIELHGASILKVEGAEVFSAYVPGPKGPVFMTLLERTFGKEITTRTVETVRKCAAA